MNVYTAQKFAIRLLVVLFVVALFAVALAVRAESGKYVRDEAGGECHAYNTSTGVIQPVYGYCQDDVSYYPHGWYTSSTSDPVVTTGKHSHKSNGTPPVIDDGGVTVPSPKNHKDHGNHYGNDKGDNNCKDVKNRHNTCKPSESTLFGLMIAVLLSSGKVIRMDGVRDVNRHSFDGSRDGVTVSKSFDDDIAFYDIPDSLIQSVYLSESPFTHTDEEEWNKYLRD